MNLSKKFLNIRSGLKKNRKKLVAISGSFDILHAGHINSFAEARAQGDFLLVLLNSDKSIKKYKGHNRPVNNQKDRKCILEAIKYVDYVLLFDEINPKEILAKIKPDIYCQGKDWGKKCVEKSVVEKNGGKIHILKWNTGKSTTKIIKKIIEVNKNPEIRAVFFDRDGTINRNEPEYVHKVADFKFMPKALVGLRQIAKAGFKLVIVTNQSGIGRKFFSNKDVEKLHDWLIEKLKNEKIEIDKIYYCPHLPLDNCDCRKPKTGMLLDAAKDLNLNLSQSWIIGDKEEDILAGRETNLKTIRIVTKKSEKTAANFIAENLLEASKIIRNNSQ